MPRNPIEQLFEELTQGLEEQLGKKGKKKKKVEVGTINDEIKRAFIDHKESEEELEEEIELRIKQLENQVKRTVRKEYSERIVAMEQQKKNVWNMIYELNTLNPNDDYTLNISEEKVYKVVSEENPFRL